MKISNVISTFLVATVAFTGFGFQEARAVSGVYECDKIPYRSRKPVKWRGAVTFRVEPAIYDVPEFRSAMDWVANEWSWASKDNLSVSFVRGSNSDTHRSGNNVNEIYYASIPGSTIADAQMKWGSPAWDNGRCYFKEADIRFDTAIEWTGNRETGTRMVIGGKSALNFGLVLVHEVGHALGLKHDDTKPRSMNSAYPNGGPVGPWHLETPLAGDRQVLRNVYGTGRQNIDVAASRWLTPFASDTFYGDSEPSSVIPIELYNVDRSVTPAQWTPVLSWSIQSGREVQLVYNVSNLGTSSSTFRVKFYSSKDPDLGGSDDIYLGSTTLTLSAGQSYLGAKAIRPRVASNEYRTFGYKIDQLSGEYSDNTNSATLRKRYYVQVN